MRGSAGRRGVALAITAVLWVFPGAAHADGASDCGRHGQAPATATDHELRTSVLCLLNQIRENRGIPPFEFNESLRRSASAHSVSMVRSRTLSHYGPGGSTVLTRVARAGYLASASRFRIAENIGAGGGQEFGSPRAIVNAWMRSPGHRENILDRGLRDFGVGVARGNPYGHDRNAATYTVDFGTRWR